MKYILLGCFALQGLINVLLFGFPPVMFSVVIPNSIYKEIYWLVPFLIVFYLLLAVASLYYLGASGYAGNPPVPKRGRLLGFLYFSLGAVGSAWVLPEFSTPREGVIRLAFVLWLLSSVCGIVALWRLKESVTGLVAAVVMVLVLVSAFLSFVTAGWLAEDYGVHLRASEGIPENATVIVAHPQNVSPPNGF